MINIFGESVKLKLKKNSIKNDRQSNELFFHLFRKDLRCNNIWNWHQTHATKKDDTRKAKRWNPFKGWILNPEPTINTKENITGCC